MAQNECVLVKRKELESLKEPYEKAKKEFEIEIEKLKEEHRELIKRMNIQMEDLREKAKQNPVDPLKLVISFEREYSSGRGFISEVTSYPIQSIKPQNFMLDTPLYSQIKNITKLISKDVLHRANEIRKIDTQKLVENTEKETRVKVLTEVANMFWLDRIDYLKEYKKKKR